MMHSIRTGDRALIRELNTAIVLNCIHKHGPIARSQIADVTGLGRSTVSGIVSTLSDVGLIDSTGAAPSTGGRKPEMLSLRHHRFYSVGFKLEPHAVRACLTDLNGHIIDQADKALSAADLNTVLDEFHSLFRHVTANYESEVLLGVGVALPGLVDPEHGTSVQPHFFPWRDKDMRSALESRLGLPVWIENDARAGALGERWALLGESEPSFLFVTVGVGIGAGIVVAGQLMQGDLVGSGHLGHTLAEENGLPCHCGLRGCLETVANDAALLRYANTGTTQYTSHRDIFHDARQGEPRALEAIHTVSRHLGIAIGNVVKLLGIRRVIVGGETAVEGGRLFIDNIRRAVHTQIFDETRRAVEVLPSRLGNDVWLTGAAAMVLETLYSPPIYAGANPILNRIVAAT